MPRYYFHLSNGTQVLDNHKGLDLPGDAAAREDAVVLARDLKHGAAMPGWDWAGWDWAVAAGAGRRRQSRCMIQVFCWLMSGMMPSGL